MIGSDTLRKKVIPITIGLAAGILLFLTAFSVILNNIVYSSEFQKEAFDRLGTYGIIVELAETFSTEINIPQDELKPIVQKTVTPELADFNIKLLIDGFISYFRGYTKSLPDIHLATSFAPPGAAAAQSLASIEKINLSVLFMIFDERHITNIMLVISLFQFALTYIPIFALLLFVTLFALLLQKPARELRAWLQSTVATYSVLCLAAGCLIQFILFFILPYLSGLIDKPKLLSEKELTSYIIICANTLSVQLILLGTILFGAVHAAVILSDYAGKSTSADICTHTCSCELSFAGINAIEQAQNTQFSRKISIILLVLISLSSIGFYAQVQTARQSFTNRNLARAVSFLKGDNYYYQVVNARNAQVYLLDVTVLDSITQLPVQDLAAKVSASGENDNESIRCSTDSKGSAVFLLGKGCYRLTLDYLGSLADYSLPERPSYEFEMTVPGKSELTVILDRQANGLTYIKEATMQYIP